MKTPKKQDSGSGGSGSIKLQIPKVQNYGCNTIYIEKVDGMVDAQHEFEMDEHREDQLLMGGSTVSVD
jgi:hypothetical protein